MLEFLRQLAAGLQDTWQRLSLSARVQIGVTTFVTVVLLGIVVFLGSRPQYVRLYSRVDPSEASEIVSWLEDNNVPYELSQGGTTIQVPAKDVQRARVNLVEMGLPRTQGVSTGFELFDQRDLMTNEWLQNVDFMRAIQGEAQFQLNQFDFVRNSYVLIRESPEELFVSEQKPSQASVMLDTARPLTPREVKAIVQIVGSFGGPHLNSQNITVATTDGTLLHSPAEDEFTALASNQFEAQAALEKQREEKVREAFEQIGVNAIVRVSALMDWSTEERTVKEVSEGTPLSTLDQETTTRTTEAPPEGAPGAVANIPEGLGGGQSILSETETAELLENYEPSETLSTTKSQGGTVRRYNVSAFIEGTYETDEETGETTYVPLTDDQITQYTDFISNAVGTGSEDTEIAVFDHPFEIERLAEAQAPAAAVQVPWWQSDMLKWGLQGILVLVAFFAIRYFMRQSLVTAPVEEEKVEGPLESEEERRQQEVVQEVDRLSREDPEAVASLLRTWLTDED